MPLTGMTRWSVIVCGGTLQLPSASGPANLIRAPRGVAALRGGLPFGAIMATAGVSALAGRCGVAPLMRPLLGLAIVQAVWTSVRSIGVHRAQSRFVWRAWWTVGPAHEHCGVHTVPLGLAVIASGMLAIDPPATGGSLVVAGLCLVVAWVTTVMAVGRFTWSLATRGLDLHSFDGTWFLVPATFLGVAIATGRMASALAGYWPDPMRRLAAASTVIGALGYWAFFVLAGLRIRRYGLAHVARVSWWIAMGCAGLGAAALGQVLQQRPRVLPAQWLADATVMSIGAALLLSVPVLLLSAWFLLRESGFRAMAPWPPTFSTSVFALGALQAGQVLHASVLSTLGVGAADATLVLWSATAGWNLKCVYTAWSIGARRS